MMHTVIDVVGRVLCLGMRREVDLHSTAVFRTAWPPHAGLPQCMQSQTSPPLHEHISIAAEAGACAIEGTQFGAHLAGCKEVHIHTIHQHPIGLGQPRVPESTEDRISSMSWPTWQTGEPHSHLCQESLSQRASAPLQAPL